MTQRWLAVLLVAVAAVPSSAQDKPGATPARPAASAKRDTLTFDSLTVKPDELPANVKIVDGLPCVARQPWAYFQTPSVWDLATPEVRERAGELLKSIPSPKRKSSQAFQAEGGSAGSVMWYEFDGDGATKVEPWMRGYLWGEAKGPTPNYPETVTVVGNVLIVTSFRQGDPAHEWFKERLRKKFGFHAPRWSEDLAKLVGTAMRAMDSKDFAAGLAALAANEPLVTPEAFLNYLRGELASAKGDFALAEKGYRRALELHESRDDPLDEILEFPVLDGLGGSLLMEKKPAAAVPYLERATALGRARRVKGWTTSSYNLACAHALTKTWDKSLAALKDAVEAEPRFRDQAKTDDDLKEAVKRPEFRKLLGM